MKPRIEKFKEVLRAKQGNVSAMADAFNCERRTVAYWIEKDKRFIDAYHDYKESQIDVSENRLFTSVQGVPNIDPNTGKFIGWLVEPNMTAIIFHLKTKGKSRGYIERQEMDNIQADSFKEIMIRARQRKNKTAGN